MATGSRGQTGAVSVAAPAVLGGACEVALAPEDAWVEYSQNASH